ncbi:MAG: metallophosphoesterase [Bacilli bacterium]
MKILCFSDLHITSAEIDSPICLSLKTVISDNDPDVIVIAGDVFDNPNIHPYRYLSSLTELPIVCCLGNHEFYHHGGVDRTLEFYRKNIIDGCNVVYLDVVGSHKVDDVLFVGNVLWYDGSMKNYPFQTDEIVPNWLDSQIVNFDWRKENLLCEQQIKEHFSHEAGKRVLLTHCVPHVSLNRHYVRPSPFNMYSGVVDLFSKLDIYPELSISGHTHREVELVINGVHCYNVGNDYFSEGGRVRFKVLNI